MLITMTERGDGPRFDPGGPELVYMQIADDIAGQISRGELAPNARLPSEPDLAEHYGAARMTIRRAMRELRERGLIRTVLGKGSYVIAQLARGSGVTQSFTSPPDARLGRDPDRQD
jgi:DNA-binding GntR family transcriptional regulator